MIEQRFISLGLDIGTTTTHLIFSELELTAVGEPGQVPRPGIGERKILHRGRVRFTPLLGGDRIDPAGVEAIIREEYAAAGFKPEQVKSGAVLVTGESARKENAEEVAARIADLAGGFVAAAAGPNLEGLLAGRGAGAAELSRRMRRRVLNIDIGGGTANFAWFDRGRFLDAACLRVGARHVRLDPDGRVTGFTDIGALAASRAGVALRVGEVLSPEARRAICGVLADALMEGIAGRFAEDPITVTRPVLVPESAETVMFSGGVGELMRGSGSFSSPIWFGDVGPELAKSILDRKNASAAEWAYPDEPIRATVIGAGLYAAQVSGDTIWAEPKLLPLVNVPVLHPFRWVSDLLNSTAPTAAIRSAANKADVDPSAQPFAVMLPSLVELDLEGIKQVAANLVAAVKELKSRPPLVLLMSDDLGRTLGKLLAEPLAGGVVAVDELDCSDVEYVDIGRLLDDVVPVVLKTLAFG